MKKVLIIGGNAAGMSAASQVKRLKPEWTVIVYEKSSYISYASCGIPYYIEGIVPSLDKLIALTPDQAAGERGVDLRLNQEVLAIDTAEKVLTVQTADGLEQERFDCLVIATGALTSTEGVRVTRSERIFSIKDLMDAEALQTFLAHKRPRSCAVIGGGYIALEMLEALKKRGVKTHLVHRRSRLARTFEPEISDIVMDKLAKEGIILNLDTAVEALEERDGQVVVKTESGELLFDCAIVAIGVKPNTGLLKNTPIALGVKDSIRVNRFMQTNLESIYAAGDCTEATHLITGKPVFVPLALKANKEGVIAGANICGGREEFPGIMGTAITKFFDLGIARTGLTLREAEGSTFDPIQFKVTSHSIAGYYPGMGTLTTILTVDKNHGRLLGAQLAGPLDSVKRIDVYATALANKMTLEQIYNLDLAYAPPFSPVYDPVILAARVGRKLTRS
jgi:CoA-dependent NAD(P)H sulfur oxidoreductase